MSEETASFDPMFFTMHHGPFEAIVERDEESGMFRGRVWLEDGSGGFSFAAPTRDQLPAEFEISAREFEAVCQELPRPLWVDPMATGRTERSLKTGTPPSYGSRPPKGL